MLAGLIKLKDSSKRLQNENVPKYAQKFPLCMVILTLGKEGSKNSSNSWQHKSQVS